MRLSKNAKELLLKSKDSATQAVATYNDPRSSFRTGNYTVLMIIAWTSLCHAYFEKNKINYYWKKPNGRFEYVDGEKKAWELSQCVKEIFGENNPVRKNIELFIKLRNKIEHRNLPALDPELAGESQALIINYEEWLTKIFGQKNTLLDSIFVPLQLTQEQKRKIQPSSNEKNVIQFIRTYRSILSSEVDGSQNYAFKAFLVPKIGNHRDSSDLAIEFVKFDEANPEEMKVYQKAIVGIREKQVPVANKGLMKPSDVVQRLELKGYFDGESIGKQRHWHTVMWKKYGVRPVNAAKNKGSKCDQKYCIYNEVHNDFLYTNAWVNFLEEKELKMVLGNKLA